MYNTDYYRERRRETQVEGQKKKKPLIDELLHCSGCTYSAVISYSS